jgi:hypothetical protein
MNDVRESSSAAAAWIDLVVETFAYECNGCEQGLCPGVVGHIDMPPGMCFQTGQGAIDRLTGSALSFRSCLDARDDLDEALRPSRLNNACSALGDGSVEVGYLSRYLGLVTGCVNRFMSQFEGARPAPTRFFDPRTESLEILLYRREWVRALEDNLARWFASGIDPCGAALGLAFGDSIDPALLAEAIARATTGFYDARFYDPATGTWSSGRAWAPGRRFLGDSLWLIACAPRRAFRPRDDRFSPMPPNRWSI